MKKIVFLISVLCCLFVISGCGKPVDKDFLEDFKKGRLTVKDDKDKKDVLPLLKKYKNGRFEDKELKDVATKFCESYILIIDGNRTKTKEINDALAYHYLAYKRINSVYIDGVKPVKDVKYTKNTDTLNKRIDKMFSSEDITIDTHGGISSIDGLVNTTGVSFEELTIKFDLKKDGEWVDSLEEDIVYINNGLPFEIIFKSHEIFDSIEITDYDYKVLPEKFAKY